MYFWLVTAGHRICGDRTLKVRSGTYLEPYPPFHGSGVIHVDANFISVVLAKHGCAGGLSANLCSLIPFDVVPQFSSAVLLSAPLNTRMPIIFVHSVPFPDPIVPLSGSTTPNPFLPQSGFPRVLLVLTIVNAVEWLSQALHLHRPMRQFERVCSFLVLEYQSSGFLSGSIDLPRRCRPTCSLHCLRRLIRFMQFSKSVHLTPWVVFFTVSTAFWELRSSHSRGFRDRFLQLRFLTHSAPVLQSAYVAVPTQGYPLFIVTHPFIHSSSVLHQVFRCCIYFVGTSSC